MRKLNFLLSLMTDENDFQREQAAAAEEAARRLDVGLNIIYSDNDAIYQSQQLLEAIQSSSERPDGIIFEPVGTGLAQVAHAAVSAGIGWVVLNRDVDYIPELRRKSRVPIFAISSDHEEIGRIQGRQIAALVPPDGCILHIQGPASSTATLHRSSGMMETKPVSVHIRAIRGQWTEESAYRAVTSWYALSTSRQVPIHAVVAQNDVMAIGARKAIENQTSGSDREHWSHVPFTGCDGLPQTGRLWTDRGQLTATVHIPASTPQAMEMLVRAIRTETQPAERTLTVPSSYPPLEKLKDRAQTVTRI